MRAPIVITSLILALAVALPAASQTPDRGGVLATYSLAHPAPQDGRFAVEADLRIAGSPVLLVGHVAADGSGGVGPRVQHDIGPVTLFGHALYGQFAYGADADAQSKLKHGAGVDVPVGAHAIIRLGIDHTPGPMDTSVTATSVGVGWRW